MEVNIVICDSCLSIVLATSDTLGRGSCRSQRHTSMHVNRCQPSPVRVRGHTADRDVEGTVVIACASAQSTLQRMIVQCKHGRPLIPFATPERNRKSPSFALCPAISNRRQAQTSRGTEAALAQSGQTNETECKPFRR